MAEITVYGTRMSPFVEKVVRALQRKQQPFELVEPKGPGDLKKWNAQTGKMPVAELAGERLFDSTLIVRRIDELFPEPPLIPQDPAAAAAQRLLEDWADESLYWHTMALRWNPGHVDATLDQILGNVPRLLRPVVDRVAKRQFAQIPWQQGLGRLPEPMLLEAFDARMADLEAMLAGRDFYWSKQPGVGDLAVYAQLRAARGEVTPELDGLIRRRPVLVDYMKRVEQATGG